MQLYIEIEKFLFPVPGLDFEPEAYSPRPGRGIFGWANSQPAGSLEF
jgi:hypothetical protein